MHLEKYHLVDGNYYKLDYGEAFYGAVYEMKYVGV